MRDSRAAIYVTLHEGSKTAEWYIVSEQGAGSDLLSDGFCDLSKLLSDLSLSLGAWLSQQTAGWSPCTDHTSM